MDAAWQYLQNLTDAQSIIDLGFYFLLFVVFAETGLFFGFFLPGDYLLFSAGLLCATGSFDVPVYILVISLTAAGILGNFAGYWFGYRAGPSLFKKENSLFFRQHHLQMARDFFSKYGGAALILGRFFPIIRTFAPIFAGAAGVDFRKFTIFNITGSAAWVGLFTFAGYFLGMRYPQLRFYMDYIILGLIIFTTIPLLLAALNRRRLGQANERQELK